MQTQTITLETLVENIVQDARKDALATRDAMWTIYELHKKRLERLFLPCDQYEQACRNLAEALNI